LRDQLKAQLTANGIAVPEVDALQWTDTRDNFDAKAGEVGVLAEPNEDKRSLAELVIYGLKGLAAYIEHAERLGYEDLSINQFICDAMAALTVDNLDLDGLVALTLQTGEFGVKGMAILDSANTGSYGHPEMTEVSIDVRENPGILISGHDLKDLEMLLQQTEGTGVDVYTHGEMLPAHYYPAFKKYKHFVGNYGNAWWKQREEFSSFNGPIIFTTNCIVPPLSNANYKDKVFTTGATGYPGWKHVPMKDNGEKDFSEIIALAKTCPAPTSIEKGSIVGGFAHNQVFALADKVVEAVKSGAIRKFVVMSGCDGRHKGRDYYTEFAKALPQDTVILTSGCAKFRYNKLGLGDINGIPRVLDAGQCNDSYSLALIALKLKEVFGVESVNDLPIAYNIAWYEQKAIIVLLGLLYLGVKNIHVGPTLPGFLSPNVAKVLVDNFGIAGITDVDNDMKLFGLA
ncbi:MAG: hydroxylamine reductase, partial [Bacteroidaceae bacterium]|nr:hydroxylamine reductase [Bacteroidaceae bacterium]